MPNDSSSGKSTPDQIRQRFDGDVERFSNLDTGQATTIDAALAMNLVAEAAAAATPEAQRLLDVGCGAGNYTLALLPHLPDLDVTLVDLSRPMLDRAGERISAVSDGAVTSIQSDIRSLDLQPDAFDIILASAVLHHLRGDADWETVFSRFYNTLRPGGSIWIFDLVEHSSTSIQNLMWARYGAYLVSLKDTAYRNHVFNYIQEEDSPRPLLYQVDLLRRVGFETVDILHKNSCFAAFGAVKGG